MQEMSSTIRAIAETCIATLSGVEALPHKIKGVAFEERLQKDEVQSGASHSNVCRTNFTLL